MTAPAAGVPRLMYFVDARLAQLGLSKRAAARRGCPAPSTLPRALTTAGQNTPTVRTLLRIDRALGWQPGSAAAVMLGGAPLSITARTTHPACAGHGYFDRDARHPCWDGCLWPERERRAPARAGSPIEQPRVAPRPVQPG
jgi:hypothetical protein